MGKAELADTLLRQGMADQQGLLRARTLTHLGMIRASKNEIREAFSCYEQALNSSSLPARSHASLGRWSG
ncbi:MAG: hypothetical protein R3F37_14805 [Candidatus Competibacteraceae bacterium]